MRTVRTKLVLLTIVVTLTLPALAGDKNKDNYPQLSVTEMVKAGHALAGKMIVVSGCYNSGFEWNYLFPCEAPDDKAKRVWVVTSAEFRGHKKLKETSTRYCHVEVLGTLETGETYGHLNGYQYQLTVYRVYSFKDQRENPR